MSFLSPSAKYNYEIKEKGCKKTPLGLPSSIDSAIVVDCRIKLSLMRNSPQLLRNLDWTPQLTPK